MSRRASRATVAARRKAIAVRRERAQRATPFADAPAKDTSSKRSEVTPQRPDASDARLWNALLVGGGAVATALFGRQIADIVADRSRPTLLHNDITSAAISLAVLVTIGVFAYIRWRRGSRGDLAGTNGRPAR